MEQNVDARETFFPFLLVQLHLRTGTAFLSMLLSGWPIFKVERNRWREPSRTATTLSDTAASPLPELASSGRGGGARPRSCRGAPFSVCVRFFRRPRPSAIASVLSLHSDPPRILFVLADRGGRSVVRHNQTFSIVV